MARTESFLGLLQGFKNVHIDTTMEVTSLNQVHTSPSYRSSKNNEVSFSVESNTCSSSSSSSSFTEMDKNPHDKEKQPVTFPKVSHCSTNSADTQELQNPKKSVGPNDFEMICVVGRGAFGKVIQVRHKQTNCVYAMKIVSKKYLVSKSFVSYMQAERDIMTKISHPFIVGLKYAFQTDVKVYLVMPYISGGELFSHLRREGLLLEDAARFYIAEIVLALEHLHSLGIIHRDLKPENILLDGSGHICLTDFGLAKSMANDDDSATTICGTNEYMAPEMIRGGGYSKPVDWWALGALVYEMMVGYSPFKGKNKKKIQQSILSAKIVLPSWLSSEAHSLIKQLLERNIDKRLGSGKSSMFQVRGVAAIKKHPFFKSIDWNKLLAKEISPPIRPVVNDELDTSNFDKEFTMMSPSDSMGGTPRNGLFSRFSFNAQDKAM